MISVTLLAIVILFVVIGLVVAIAKARHPGRLLLGIVFFFAFFVAAGAALFALRVRHSPTLRSQTSPSLYRNTYPMAPEATGIRIGDQIAIGPDGVSLRDGDQSVVIKDGSGTTTDGHESVRISGDGVVIDQPANKNGKTDQRTLPPRADSLVEQTPRDSIAAEAIEAPATESDQWIDASQADFEADLYPSERSAAVAGVRRLTKSIHRVLPDGQEPSRVLLVSADSELQPDVVPAVVRALQSTFGNNHVEMDKPPQIVRTQEVERVPVNPSSAPAEPQADTTVRIRIDGNFSYVHGGRGVIPSEKKGGDIKIEMIGPSGKHTQTAKFVNKPWVEDGIDRAGQQPGQELIVARTTRLFPTRGEAEQQAIVNAANKLIPLVRTALDRLENERPNQPRTGLAPLRRVRPDHAIGDGVRAEMQRGGGVKNQFTQQLQRPYGTVWQRALLIDASDAQIDRYAKSLLPKIIQEQRTATRIRETWFRTGASFALLTVLITVVYAFLNAATKGYYTWLLRGSMVVLVLAGTVLLLFMA